MKAKKEGKFEKGFTLIELLCAVFVISLLMSIMLPSISRVKRQARSIMNAQNQREVVCSAGMYGFDNDGRFPESVATMGRDDFWNWTEPMMLIGDEQRTPANHRAMSEYLSGYLNDCDTVFCVNSPSRNQFLEDAWRAGDDWDNPETYPVRDPLSGTFCFYWNYRGYLEGYGYPFRGPSDSAGRGSGLLISDYVGWNHWRSPDSFGSCERLRSAKVTKGTAVSSDYWSVYTENVADEVNIEINPRAGWIDGHVESFSTAEAVKMRVSLMPDGSIPYPEGVGPGVFFLPEEAVSFSR